MSNERSRERPRRRDPPRRVVIGVGNEFRRDDGIGPAVVEHLREHVPGSVALTVTDGEPTQLLDAWDGADLAVVIDAVLCEPSVPGRIHRTEAVPLHAATASTHGLGIPDAVRLADALDRAPRRLVVYAVEASDIGFGRGLTPAVAAALPTVTRAVLSEIPR